MVRRGVYHIAHSRALFCAFLASACTNTEKKSTAEQGVEQEAAIPQSARVEAPVEPPRREREDPARVDLSGATPSLSVAEVGRGPRVYAKELRTWVRKEPRSDSERLGYLRAGGSSPTEETPAGFQGCKGGWYPVQPEGFVCVGAHATLKADDPVFRLFEPYPPRGDQRLPYLYGTVRKPGPMYTRLPERQELTKSEPDLDQRFERWLEADGDVGASFRQEVWNWGKVAVDPRQAWESRLTRGVLPLLTEGRRLPSPTGTPRPVTLVLDQMESRVGHAFLETFFSEGRRYGLTTHLELAPTDRYRPLEGSDFHGVEIGKDVSFPFAFVRRVGSKFADGEKADYRAVLPLTGKRKFIKGRLHYETNQGKYISDRYASELTLAQNMPGWAKKGEKWMSISINKQTLVLYEGETPVYATLVSTGEAGLESHEDTTATKQGIFRVHTKHITSTMSSDEIGEEFELRDVPYVQYFAKGGFALHGAYWHDRFGTPKSHGCINLAPEDARRIFHWTDPPVPRGWHAAMSPLRGTVVFVHP